jgi:hypothetical protein
MSESSRPELPEIAVVLVHLADRVSADPGPGLDPIVCASLRRAVVELQRFIPGLEPPPDAMAAHAMSIAAAAALEDGEARKALSTALRGLSFAPHDPELHYLAGSACFELGAVPDALVLLGHVLWIHPGHPSAKRDLESLSLVAGPAPAAGASAPPPRSSSSAFAGDAPQLRFELWDDGYDALEDDHRAPVEDWLEDGSSDDEASWPYYPGDELEAEDPEGFWLEDDADEDRRAA